MDSVLSVRESLLKTVYMWSWIIIYKYVIELACHWSTFILLLTWDQRIVNCSANRIWKLYNRFKCTHQYNYTHKHHAITTCHGQCTIQKMCYSVHPCISTHKHMQIIVIHNTHTHTHAHACTNSDLQTFYCYYQLTHNLTSEFLSLFKKCYEYFSLIFSL